MKHQKLTSIWGVTRDVFRTKMSFSRKQKSDNQVMESVSIKSLK